MQAQVQIQKKPENPGKPDKPGEEEATWAARIPTRDSGYMFYGMADIDGYYENNDTNIQVSVEKSGLGTWRKYYDFVYSFNFKLINENVGTESPYYVGFQGVDDLYEKTYPDEGKPCCQFPGDPSCAEGDCIDCLPSCMGTFLNENTHPHKDYVSFYFVVEVFDQDIDLMQPGEYYIFGSASDRIGLDDYDPGDYLFMVSRYRDKCEPDPAYHDIEIKRNINYLRALELENPVNIEIERLDTAAYETAFGIASDGVWRIQVYPNDAHGSSGKPGFLKVQERYCTRDKSRATWYYSMEAKGCFNFYIDFIKNPTPGQ